MTAKIFKSLEFFLIAMTAFTENCTAEVSNDFEKCKQFFYKEKPPIYMGNQARPDVRNICQMYNNKYYYATSYDTKRRIPHYSAYSLETFKQDGSRYGGWMNEPQLQNRSSDPNMVGNDDDYRQFQAVDKDYSNEDGYDRGHLSPQMFHSQSEDSRQASMSLTNIAPQVGKTFNQAIWREFEEALFVVSKKYCNFEGAKRYFITGVLPSKNKKLNGRVNIPTHYWTAVCCDSSGTENKMEHGWSAGFIAENVENPYLLYEPVSKLAKTIGFNTIFGQRKKKDPEHCNFNSDNTNKIVDDIFNKSKIKELMQKTKNEDQKKKKNKETEKKNTCSIPKKFYYN